jgi:hypothetical protein
LRRLQFESEERLRKQQRQAEKGKVADERAAQNEDNWRDLKQWREKESGRIDECRQDIDHLLESIQDVKADLNMQGKNLREIDASHRKANEELHRMLQKQSQFRERTDERVDACERSVDEIHQRLRTITLKIEEPPRPAIINQHVRREVGFRPIEREVSPVRGLDRESPILFSPRAIRGQEEFLSLPLRGMDERDLWFHQRQLFSYPILEVTPTLSYSRGHAKLLQYTTDGQMNNCVCRF